MLAVSTLSVCHFFILEKVHLSGLKLTSVHSKCSTFFKWKLFRKKNKASGSSAVTAVIYAGTAQSLNGLACDLLAHETLY